MAAIRKVVRLRTRIRKRQGICPRVVGRFRYGWLNVRSAGANKAIETMRSTIIILKNKWPPLDRLGTLFNDISFLPPPPTLGGLFSRRSSWTTYDL